MRFELSLFRRFELFVVVRVGGFSIGFVLGIGFLDLCKSRRYDCFGAGNEIRD